MSGLKLADGVSFTDGNPTGTLCVKSSDKVFTLNNVGCIVVREIVLGHRSNLSEVVGGIEKLFEDPEGKLGDETRAFVRALEAAGLVEIKP